MLWLKDPGFIVSGAGHGLVLAAMLFGFSSAKPFEEASETVAVDVISESQFREIMKGDKHEKEVRKEASLRVDRIAPVEEKKDPGTEKRDSPAPPPPPLRPTVKAAEEDVDEEKPAPAPQKVPAPPRPEVKQAVAPPKPPEKVERQEVEKDAEVIKRAAVTPPKLPEKKEPPKEDPLQKLMEQQKAEEAKKKAEELKKLEEAKKKAAEAARKLAEAKKAAEEKKAKDKAESDKLQAAIRNRLLVSRDAPAASGSTGQQVSRVASAGLATATGQKLSPSDREALMGLIKEQMEKCWSITGTQSPSVKPMVRLQLSPTGTIIANPVLVNTSGDGAFAAIAESGMRAIRQCAPYRIPPRFADKYDDWKTITVKLDPSDLL